MRTQRFAPLPALALAMLAGAAQAQLARPGGPTDDGCDHCVRTSFDHTNYSTWTLSVNTGGYTIVSYYVTGAAGAMANTRWDGTNCKMCPLGEGGVSSMVATGNGTSINLSVVADEELGDGYASVYATSTVASISLFQRSGTSSESGHMFSNTGLCGASEPIPYSQHGHGLGISWGVMARSFVLQKTGSGPFTYTLTRDMNSTLAYFHEDCNDGPTDTPVPVNVQSVNVRIAWDDGNLNEETWQGVFWIDDEGDSHLMGFFDDDPAYGPTSGPNSWQTLASTDFEVNFGSADLNEVAIETSDDMFSSFDGNINRDWWTSDEAARTCWLDRAALLALVGTDIDDYAYNARADFDLDGDIDIADLAAFNQVCGSCDVNSDRDVTPSDYMAYISLYGANDPTADMDGVNGVTIDDYSIFYDLYVEQINCDL